MVIFHCYVSSPEGSCYYAWAAFLLRQRHWQETLRLRQFSWIGDVTSCHENSSIFTIKSSQVFFSAKPGFFLHRLTVLEKRRPNSNPTLLPDVSIRFFLSQQCSGGTVLKTSLGFHIKWNQSEGASDRQTKWCWRLALSCRNSWSCDCKMSVTCGQLPSNNQRPWLER